MEAHNSDARECSVRFQFDQLPTESTDAHVIRLTKQRSDTTKKWDTKKETAENREWRIERNETFNNDEYTVRLQLASVLPCCTVLQIKL
jgi:hypothetical protein